MTCSDRGDERRRLLAAVRSGDADDEEDAFDPEELAETPIEPKPDGGAVVTETPLVHCEECDRAYQEAPVTCDRCGGTAFAPRSAE